ncbi:MAG: CDP-diacylglycerol--glycerol-3-phosphate 3-phosphatidyltransferase [Myxococcaceae bacterium]|nr:CDP-diacylglycerol--glycerol-3-phosphate 3-phosphatidyltransferase [Myxococcaceae bacterium]
MREAYTLKELDRRPIATRDSPWAHRLAGRLAQLGLTPNFISVLSVLFATLGGLALWWSSKLLPFEACPFYLLTAVCIQLRLVCNLLDGMVAIEGGKKTPSGAVFNELPDRISDTVLFLGAGCGVGGAWGATLGFAASLSAMSTAYVRLLGASVGVPHDFSGPMAKQHRMALLTAAVLAAAVLCHFDRERALLACALWMVTVGSLWTAVRRAARVVQKLGGGA